MRIAALLFLVSIDASALGTHCAPDETIAFSCSVSASKVVSVCLVKGSSKQPPAVSYRFGPLDSAELVFPSSPAGSAQQFRYAHYFRYQVDRTELSFSNGDAGYTVFDYFDGEEKPALARGVKVSLHGKNRELRCKGEVISHLIELENVVLCDAENALASCG